MAKSDKAKTKKSGKSKSAGVTIKVKAGKSKAGKDNKGFEALSRFAENPIVADLIAIGATAAVTALTTGRSGKSGNAVKNAGKAAAAAIGARLMTEYQAVKDSAADAKAKEAKTTKKA